MFGQIKSALLGTDRIFVQNFTPPDFQAKNFTPSISPNFNSFSKKKTQKNEWKWRNLHRWQKFYTAAGTDGMDKFHLCRHPTLFVHTIAGLNTVRSRQQAPCRQMGISSMYCINNIRPKTKDKLGHCIGRPNVRHSIVCKIGHKKFWQRTNLIHRTGNFETGHVIETPSFDREY